MSIDEQIMGILGIEDTTGSVDTPTPGDEASLSVAASSVSTFQSVVSGFAFASTDGKTLRRSSRLIKRATNCKVENTAVELSEEKTTKSSASAVELEPGTSIKIRKRKSLTGLTRINSTKKKQKRGYADPEKYAHLNGLRDVLGMELDVLFCGINPGEYSATVGHHFANPTNHFWRCLHASGFTDELISPSEDYTLADRFSLGLTNLVDRPTAGQDELSNGEQTAGVPSLLSKVARHRPYVMCFIGLGIAKMVKTYCLPRRNSSVSQASPSIGFQPYKLVYDNDQKDVPRVKQTLFYAVPSTSGRVVQFQRDDKTKILKDLRDKLADIKSGSFDSSAFHPVSASLIQVSA
ncbi:hypothetical protein AMATHDRAFT_66979 [Amanita thiersii Skay4041]|uniref:Uracil-DNA glycosylase-like domain-containing protein n=1 Tax=Amanita thiersii Skay4041 TaxID=703135 RepID=A0A2A9NEH9_9AGAR|nr:hypothetical protein AMATHDRAFT_66979 [Amanita thiersii Skay4041]